MFNDPVYVVRRYIGPQSLKDLQHNMRTMSCHNGVSTKGMKMSEMGTQLLHMRKELDSHPQPQMRKKTESACDMVLLSR
jgi:hypothetical protein